MLVPLYEADRLRMGKPVWRVCLSKQTTTELVAWLLRRQSRPDLRRLQLLLEAPTPADQPVRGRRPSLTVMVMPTVRLEMGLQDLGRPT